MSHDTRTSVACRTALLVIGALAWSLPGLAQGAHPLVERVLRTKLTSVKFVFAPGQDGNVERIIGVDTTSEVYLITEPIRAGVLPPQTEAMGKPVARTSARIRFRKGDYLDKRKPLQLARGVGRYTSKALSFAFRGTVIIRWSHDAKGRYNGTRWTDFSAGMSDIKGDHAGWTGHLVGTRLLVGEPRFETQSGILILRLSKPRPVAAD